MKKKLSGFEALKKTSLEHKDAYFKKKKDVASKMSKNELKKKYPRWFN